MSQRILQALFITALLGFAFLILGRGVPRLFSPARTQAPAPWPVPHPIDFSPLGVAERQAAVTCVRAQLQAFQKGRFRDAMQMMSRDSEVRAASAAEFQSLMQTQYPMLLHVQSVAFGRDGVRENAAYVDLRVFLQDHHGGVAPVLYELERVGGRGHRYQVFGIETGIGPPPYPFPVPPPFHPLFPPGHGSDDRPHRWELAPGSQ